MGRNNQKYWYSYSQKPPTGFSAIKDSIGYYTQNTDLIIINNDIKVYCDKIKIRFKITIGKDIDFGETEKMICTDYDLKDITINDSFFKRDSGLFPYILSIKSYDKIEDYLSFKTIKNRSYKLKKLLDKK